MRLRPAELLYIFKTQIEFVLALKRQGRACSQLALSSFSLTFRKLRDNPRQFVLKYTELYDIRTLDRTALEELRPILGQQYDDDHDKVFHTLGKEGTESEQLAIYRGLVHLVLCNMMNLMVCF